MNAKDLCEKIRSIYPELGGCGGDVRVSYDDTGKSWTVDLTRGNNRWSAALEPEDVTSCLEGERCASVAVQVLQLVNGAEP